MSLLPAETRKSYDEFIDELRVAIAMAGQEGTERAILTMSLAMWTPNDMRSLLVYALPRLANEVPMTFNETNGGRAA